MTLLDALKISLADKWEPAKEIPEKDWVMDQELLAGCCTVYSVMGFEHKYPNCCNCVLDDQQADLNWGCCKEFQAVMNAKTFPKFQQAVKAMCERLEREIEKLEGENGNTR